VSLDLIASSIKTLRRAVTVLTFACHIFQAAFNLDILMSMRAQKRKILDKDSEMMTIIFGFNVKGENGKKGERQNVIITNYYLSPR
jgi:hypothetical protein